MRYAKIKNEENGSEILISVWDIVDNLQTEEDRAAYIEAAWIENDPELLKAVMDDIERAKRKWPVSGDSPNSTQ